VTALGAAHRVRSLPVLQALEVRDFRLLWGSEAVSLVGDQFHFVALSWLVISLTGSGLALGTILIAVGVPRALLLVPAGVLADRRPPRSLMLTANVARAAVVGLIAWLVATDRASIPALAALGAVFGAVDALYMPAQQAFLPRAVGAGRLPSANAMLQGTIQLASIAGPPIAGVAIAVAGTGTAFAVDAVSFGLAAVLISLISGATALAVGTASPGAGAGPLAHEPFGSALRGGVRYVLHDQPIRTMMLLSLVLNLALDGPAAVGMPWLADQRFDAGPAGLGIMAAGWAAGALAGTLVAGSVRLVRQGWIVVGCVALAGVGMVLVGVLAWLPAVVVVLAVMGLVIGYVNVVAISWLQARVEAALLGRVMSLVLLMSFGVTPISLGLAGALIDVDATALFAGAGLLVLATALAAVAIGSPDMFDRPADTGDGAADVTAT
jgi:hypothetical protein